MKIQKKKKNPKIKFVQPIHIFAHEQWSCIFLLLYNNVFDQDSNTSSIDSLLFDSIFINFDGYRPVPRKLPFPTFCCNAAMPGRIYYWWNIPRSITEILEIANRWEFELNWLHE